MRDVQIPAGEPRVPAVRWRPDASSLLSLTFALPGLLCGLLVMGVLGELVLPAQPWLVPVLWLSSGAILFVRPVELLVARLVFDVRRPTPAELHKLAPVWDSVCRVARVNGARYLLFVQDSHAPNAFAAGGHIVAVTRDALRLPPAQLEAVLAHELGHHLSAHPAVSILAWWYALPARGVAFLLRLATRWCWRSAGPWPTSAARCPRSRRCWWRS